MRTIILPLLAALALYSCKKEGPGVAIGTDSTAPVLPPPPPISTMIAGFVTDDANQRLPYASQVIINGTAYDVPASGLFNTGTLQSDPLLAKALASSGDLDHLETYKTFLLTPSIKNYVKFKIARRIGNGTVTNQNGGTFPFAGSSSISFAPNTLYILPTAIYPGYYGPELAGDLFTNYLNPVANDFAVRMPCYSMTDSSGNKSFLKSYGVVRFTMQGGWVHPGTYDLYGPSKADVKLAIPESLLADAPDSIVTWSLQDGTWKKAGSAKKADNFYQAKIDHLTTLNFALPVKGAYLNLRLRTDSGATVTNTTVRIKGLGRVLAESQTDADGNTLCYVPVNEDLTVEVLPDDYIYSARSYTQNLGRITKADDRTLRLPTSTPELTSLKGYIFNCNNVPIQNSVATLSLYGREYTIPVKDGQFNTSIWLYGINNAVSVLVTDSTGNKAVTGAILSPSQKYTMNLYSCTSATGLYCHYSVDGKKYSVSDDAASPTNMLTCSQSLNGSTTAIRTNKGGLGVNFSGWPDMAGIWSSSIGDLKVNGVICQYDPSKTSVIGYYRFDEAIGGYAEGWFSIYYKDAAGGTHHVAGNFRVKRAS